MFFRYLKSYAQSAYRDKLMQTGHIRRMEEQQEALEKSAHTMIGKEEENVKKTQRIMTKDYRDEIKRLSEAIANVEEGAEIFNGS